MATRALKPGVVVGHDLGFISLNPPAEWEMLQEERFLVLAGPVPCPDVEDTEYRVRGLGPSNWGQISHAFARELRRIL